MDYGHSGQGPLSPDRRRRAQKADQPVTGNPRMKLVSTASRLSGCIKKTQLEQLRPKRSLGGGATFSIWIREVSPLAHTC